MAVGSREDPARAFNFTISLMDASSSVSQAATTIAINALTSNVDAGFSECSGLEVTLETEDFMEGGVNDRVLKFPTRVQWSKLTLKKGLMKSSGLWDWIYGFTEGRVVRKDGVISLLDPGGELHTAWEFERGLPVKYAGPRLDATQSAVAFQSIEIEHEGLHLISGASGLASAIRGAAEGISSLF